MTLLDAQLLTRALSATGAVLARGGRVDPLRLVIAGGSAGLLAGLLRTERTTADCDVMWSGTDEEWRELAAAATEVAADQGLPAAWLNRDSSMFAWCLPLGWQSRCEPAGEFGPLVVARLNRFDLIAAKVMSSPKRPGDLNDLLDIRPTTGELDAIDEHLNRLASEDLDGRTFESQRGVVRFLREGR